MLADSLMFLCSKWLIGLSGFIVSNQLVSVVGEDMFILSFRKLKIVHLLSACLSRILEEILILFGTSRMFHWLFRQAHETQISLPTQII